MTHFKSRNEIIPITS